MKRAIVTVVISAAVLGVLTVALAMAQTSRYADAELIPTVVTAQQPTAMVVPAPRVDVATAAPAAQPEAPAKQAARPDDPADKPSAGSGTQKGSTTKKSSTASSPSKKKSDDDGDGDSDREVVKRKVRDESDERSPSEGGSSSDSDRDSSGSNDD